MNCINRQSKDFINLLDKTGLQPSVLEAKIITYQDKNGINAWPSDSYFDNKLNVNFQKNQTVSDEGKIASEKTIRDLAARLSDRIGMPIEFESDRTKQYKGKIENNVAYVNLAYATLDTPIHEILGHPIIRTIKNKQGVFKIEEINDDYGLMTASGNKGKVYSVYNYINNSTTGALNTFDTKEEAEKYAKELEQNQKYQSQLYQNLLKELETGRGKEVLDRIKRDYQFKEDKLSEVFKGFLNRLEKYNADLSKTGNEQAIGIPTNYFEQLNIDGKTTFGEIKKLAEDYLENKAPKYSLEEQQEEAIVELLGLMTAEKLDKVKDGKLISLLKRLLKEMKQFIRSLINQKEVEIDKLPDNMTLGDLSDLLAYSNSKLILPGYEVLYTTPDNQQFKTYQEASNHISELAKSVEDVDLDSVQVSLRKKVNSANEIPVNKFVDEFDNTTYNKKNGKWYIGDFYRTMLDDDIVTLWNSNLSDNYINKSGVEGFIEKNKEYEQSKEIIDEWKKVNNIQYNPEEIYSRGQEFSSVVGAYSSFDVNLMMQNLLQHIEDNEKAGGQFAISAYTKPVDKQIGHLEGGGGKIKFKLYPQSKDILWASNIDVYSGSVWDASEKVNKDKKSELLGVSYTKYPSLNNVNSIQPNLAAIVDNLAHHHNELGIALTGNNFRLEYDEDIPYQTKKIIDGINSILDQKYGKLVKPEIKKIKSFIGSEYLGSKIINEIDLGDGFSKYFLEDGRIITEPNLIPGIQPTQTEDTLVESIESIKNKFSDNIGEKYLDTLEIRDYNDSFEIDGKYYNIVYYQIHNYGDSPILDKLISKEPSFNTAEEAENRIKELITEAEKIYEERKSNQKEYTEQALINTKIAKLKEVAKKYPRSLIRSEVVRTREYYPGEFSGFAEDELPFQRIPSTQLKPGVQELFDSNPELANAVYSALGFKTELPSVDNVIETDNKEEKKKRLNKRKELVLKEINAIEELIRTNPNEITLYYTALYEYDYQQTKYFDKSNWEQSTEKYKTSKVISKPSYLHSHLDEELQKRIKNLQTINSDLYSNVESVNYSNVFQENKSYSSLEILKYISNNKKDALSSIAEKLLKYSEKNNVEISILEKGEKKNIAGSYFSIKNKIEIYGKQNVTSHTLIHEIVHSLSVIDINSNPNSRQVKSLESILKNILNKKILKEYENFESSYEDYATKNIKELLSEIISRPDILSHLALYDTNYNLIKDAYKKETLLDQIVKILSDIFNFTKKEAETLGDLILLNAVEIFENSKTTSDYKTSKITPQQKQQALQLYSQYLDTTQNQFISSNDKVVFGHPTIGKSFLKKQGEDKFVTLDDDYANEVNAFVDANRGTETRQEYKGRKPREYNEFMLNLYDRLKAQAQREGKILFVSNTNILKERMSDFDKVITIPKTEFKRRFDARGATYGFEDWKSDIDATVAKVPSNKVISTTGYLADLFRGSKQDIEGFKEFVGKPKDSTVFFQQLDMFKNVLTVAQREYIKERVKSTKMYKGVLTWNPKFNNFDVKNLLEKDASDFNRQLQKELKINFLPLKLEPKKITNFSKSNATYGGKRTQFYVAKLMATDGTFPQMDTVKELRLPDPKITDQMKSILSDLGINLVNWEAYSAWYEKQYGKPLLANAIADMTNKVIAMRESGEKIDTLPEEVSHFILYTMKDVPWVKNLLARVDETPEWQEHSENYTKYYNGDMDMVRLEVLGKILAKSFVSNGEGVSKKWYRYIEELWQRFLSLFGRDNIRRRMDYLAAEVVFNPSMKKKIAVNLNRFGITPYDNVVFANLDVEDFLDTDVLNKHAKIVEKSVDALADSLRRDLNSKAASVGTRQKLYEYMLQQINKGNHTISMAYLVSTVETESNSVLRRLLQFEDDFQKERSAADFNTFARILRHTNDFTLTYKDTFTELESALMIDDLRLKSQIKVFEDMEDLNSDEKILFKNLKERKALINEVLTSIGNSKKVMTMMEQNYQKYAKHIFMNVITPMLEERFAKGQYTEEQKEVVIENLKLQLDEAKDIDAINKWMQSMAESGDDVLGIADRLTKDTIEKAKMKSISVGKDLIDLASEYEAATGSRDTSFMYGKNDAGLLTGDYITEIDTAKYVTNKALFYDELNTRYKKLSEEAVDDDARKGLSAKKKKEIANWINANTEVLDEKLREQLKKRKKEAIYAYYISDPDSESQIKLAESKYQEWLSEREKYNVDSGYTKYGKEFIVPKKEVYPSKQYKQLNPAQKEFHTKYMLMYKSMKEYMPDHIYNSNTAIQIRKDGMERILSSENKFKEFTKLLEEGFTRKVDDTERGMTDEDLSSQEKLNKRLLKNSSGRRIYTVPIHHLMKLEDSSELSTDAVSAMLAFIDTSTRYEGISEIADSLEVFGDILKYRKMITTDTLNRSSVESEGGNAYARYMKYLEMVIYGKTKNDEGIIPGTTIDVAKLIDNINNYTAMNNLAFNMYAGVANVGLGNILMREEAFAKQYVKHEDLNFAFKEYSKQLPGILNEVGEVKSKNKLRLLLEYTDALQDHENKMRDLGWAKEKHQRIVNRSHMYFMNHMGEHQMQSRMMLALMHNVKLKDSEGKDVTMYDAFEVVNNRIVIKDGITNLDGSKFSEKQIIPFNIRMKAINQRLHGIYNETDKSIIQQYALGRAAIMFRKWVVPGINRRFEKEYYNWSDMETREGFYRTSAKFLIGIIKETKDTKNLMEAYKNNLSQLTDAQKANMARAISELGYFFLLLTSGTALMMFAKGIDDDDWLLKHSANHLAHATLRIKSEMGFYVFPSDFLKLLKSPAASINTLEKILNITKFIDYSSFIDEEKTFLRRYQSGRYEDELYASVWAKGMIPTWRTISDIAYSEDKLKFLTE